TLPERDTCTTDGVNSALAASRRTPALSPSITATALLVVPRSIPKSTFSRIGVLSLLVGAGTRGGGDPDHDLGALDDPAVPAHRRPDGLGDGRPRHGGVLLLGQDRELQAEHVRLPVVVVHGDAGPAQAVRGVGQVPARHPDGAGRTLGGGGSVDPAARTPQVGRDGGNGVVGEVGLG